MSSKVWITTSWDDGHPLDWRVAELLAKHHLTGTFYIPQTFELGTLEPSQIRELGAKFDIGAHTLNHAILPLLPDAEADQEIRQSKVWLDGLIGRPTSMFCPPRGKFAKRHLKMISRAGFLGTRSVGLLSLGLPRCAEGIWLLGTTVQAFPHPTRDYFKNVLKRRNLGPTINLLRLAPDSDWVRLAEKSLFQLEKHGGVFHLWGHSWEIDAVGGWSKLDAAFGHLSQALSFARCVDNSDLCRLAPDLRENK